MDGPPSGLYCGSKLFEPCIQCSCSRLCYCATTCQCRNSGEAGCSRNSAPRRGGSETEGAASNDPAPGSFSTSLCQSDEDDRYMARGRCGFALSPRLARYCQPWTYPRQYLPL